MFSVILITFIVGNNISRFSIQLSHYYAFFYFLYFVFQKNPETFNGQFKKKKKKSIFLALVIRQTTDRNQMQNANSDDNNNHK